MGLRRHPQNRTFSGAWQSREPILRVADDSGVGRVSGFRYTTQY